MKKKVQKEKDNTIKNGDIVVRENTKLFGLIKVKEVGIVINNLILAFKGGKNKEYLLSDFLEKGICQVFTPKKYYSKAEQNILVDVYKWELYSNINDVINTIRPNTIGEKEPIEANKYYKPVMFS